MLQNDGPQQASYCGHFLDFKRNTPKKSELKEYAWALENDDQ
jgi:hypothetical protein